MISSSSRSSLALSSSLAPPSSLAPLSILTHNCHSTVARHSHDRRAIVTSAQNSQFCRANHRASDVRLSCMCHAIFALHVCELQANCGPNFARSSCGICKCVVNTNSLFKMSLISVFSRNFVSPTSPQLSQPSEILALLATDILPSEHCPVLSKCIIEHCSHEKFAIFICMYLQKKSSNTASNSLIQVVSGRLSARWSYPPPLGNFADIPYLKEQSFLHRIRDVCTLQVGA